MTVELRRHVPACNDNCFDCVMWRKVDALKLSYEQKVEDLTAETLRVATLTAESGRVMADNMGLGRALVAAERVCEAAERWFAAGITDEEAKTLRVTEAMQARIMTAREDLVAALTDWRRTKEGA